MKNNSDFGGRVHLVVIIRGSLLNFSLGLGIIKLLAIFGSIMIHSINIFVLLYFDSFDILLINNILFPCSFITVMLLLLC